MLHFPAGPRARARYFDLFTVLENIAVGFTQHMQELFGLLQSLLHDPGSGEARVTAFRALGVIAQYIGADEKAEVRAFQQLLSTMITVVLECLYSADKTGARQLFDVFETLLILEIPLLIKHVPQLASFSSNVVPTAYTMTNYVSWPSIHCLRQ